MSELQQYRPQADLAPFGGPAAGPSVEPDGVARIIQWAEGARAAHSVAEALCRTSFVPEQFRGKPEEATAAILAGGEVGLSPMAALNAFDGIQGRAAPRAITLRAIVQSRGHEMTVIELNSTRCVMEGRRQGATKWERVVWTMDRAQKLGLAGKPNWKNQPEAMLEARATSQLARRIAADAILGIPYSYEEIADGEEVTEEKPRRVSRRRLEPAPSVEEPALPDERPAESAAADTGEQVTPAQLRKLHAAMSDHNITAREDRLEYVSNVLDRRVESSNDLTKAEASRVIEALEAAPGTEEPAVVEEPPADPWGGHNGEPA